MDDCIFCKIVKGDIPCDKVLETDTVLAFKDIAPQAPVHVLVIPKAHIPSVQHLTTEDRELVGDIHLAMQEVARQFNVDQDGFRVVSNIGVHGQQTVPHLHYHVLGGRQLQWPPG